MLFFAAVDLLRDGAEPQFGMNQLAGFVISTIIVLTGMHTTRSPRAKTWFGTLLLIYITGILYMGLKTSGHHLHSAKELLITSSPPVYDFIINILGFTPFAYLYMAYQFAGKRVAHTVMPALIAISAGMGLSLFMELVQYYIPGRTSSLMDLIANTAGTLIGIAYFLLVQRLADYR